MYWRKTKQEYAANGLLKCTYKLECFYGLTYALVLA